MLSTPGLDESVDGSRSDRDSVLDDRLVIGAPEWLPSCPGRSSRGVEPVEPAGSDADEAGCSPETGCCTAGIRGTSATPKCGEETPGWTATCAGRAVPYIFPEITLGPCGIGGGGCSGGCNANSGAPPPNPTYCTGCDPNTSGPAVKLTAPAAAVDANASPTFTFEPNKTLFTVATAPEAFPTPANAGTASTSTSACARNDEHTSRSSSCVARHDGHPSKCALIRSASAPVTLPAVNPPSFSTTARHVSGPRFTDKCACKYAARNPWRARRANAAVAFADNPKCGATIAGCSPSTSVCHNTVRQRSGKLVNAVVINVCSAVRAGVSTPAPARNDNSSSVTGTSRRAPCHSHDTRRATVSK